MTEPNAKNVFVFQQIDQFVSDAGERTALFERVGRLSRAMQDISAAVIEPDRAKVDELVASALARGTDGLEVMESLISGMAVVGVKFRDNHMYVPEVLACARALKTGTDHLEGVLGRAGLTPTGTVVFGSVKGDLHDIGKNLCIVLLRGAGFRVIDLGIDVPSDEFVSAITEHQPHVVALSALLTTTMQAMAVTVDAISGAGLRDRVSIIVGGAPVSQPFADEIGADAYGKDAAACVTACEALVARASSA